MTDQAKMHADEVHIDHALAKRLVARQFPAWSNLQLRRVQSRGTVNAIFRLGDELVVRLPRTASWARTIEAIQTHDTWLRDARAGLPLSIPEPVDVAPASDDFPFPWVVHRWIDGETLSDDIADTPETAHRLGAFVRALHALEAPGANVARSVKAVSRASWDPIFRDVIAHVGEVVDVALALEVWDETLEAPGWTGASVWVHADLLADNLLQRSRALAAVIDFECYGAGDPALDLTPAWFLFSRDTRATFRDVVGGDSATWERARNHALRSVMGIRYYARTNPQFSAMCARTLRRAVYDD
jgi:aminoglycoside phosphotransferase (APT) family kinase protein